MISFFKKMTSETSKIILLLILLTYFIGVILGVILCCKNPEVPELLESLLTYIGSASTITIGFYSWKAKNENCSKYGLKYQQIETSETEEEF